MTDLRDESGVFDDVLTAFHKAADILVPPQSSNWKPLPHQIPPNWRWFMWLLMGGRGSGKTATSAKYVHDHVHGPPCLPHIPGGHWISIVAPTLGDAVTSCVNGPSGLIAHDPGVKVLNRPGGLVARWSNGVEAKLFGASTPDDVERFRAGGNRCLVWCEEMAAWRYLEEAWQQIRYGLRVGPWPRAIASTTPRSRALIKKLIQDEKIAVTHATTNDNPHLNAEIREQLYKDYANTRLGRQELLGEILEDVEGALWNSATIDATRIPQEREPEQFDRIVVGVDPAASSNEGSNEHGIIVTGYIREWYPYGLDITHPGESHGFVLADYSLSGTPTQWGRAAVRAFTEWRADLIIAEKNNGGDMVRSVIHKVDDAVPVKLVHASRGKAKRAEPISTLWDQGRAHIVGGLAQLEDQMTGWDSTDPDPSWSPDRMDAMVWALTELMSGAGKVKKKQMVDKRLRGRR